MTETSNPKQEMVEKVAKWLHSVIENGEPYDGVTEMSWEELAPQPMYQPCIPEAMRGLARQLIPLIEGDIRAEIVEAITSNTPNTCSRP